MTLDLILCECLTFLSYNIITDLMMQNLLSSNGMENIDVTRDST